MKHRTGSFRIPRTLHLSMLGGQLLFPVIAYMAQKGILRVVNESMSRTLQVAAILLSTAMLYLGFRMFKKKLAAVRNSGSSAEARMAQ